MPTLNKVSCMGCNHDFSGGRGLMSHLRQTTNRRCREILRELERPEPEEHAYEPSDTEDVSDDLEDLPSSFMGDFFGDNYTADDFPGWGDEQDLDDVLQDEEEGTEAEAERSVYHSIR